MCHPPLRHAFDVEDVVKMVRRLYDGRVAFHDGDAEIAPGISVHFVGGHTMGLQMVRVWTKRGWVVLASDAAHLYANMEQVRPFPTVYNVGDMLAGHQRAYALASSPAHVVPGHDPLVLKRYPAPSRALEGIVARLDVEPVGG
jgi:glyoxylase-like metal-dependent hydrolase (beta-lactamase superfamily II)